MNATHLLAQSAPLSWLPIIVSVCGLLLTVIGVVVSVTWLLSGIRQDVALVNQRVSNIEHERDLDRQRYQSVTQAVGEIRTSIARLEENQKFATRIQKETLAELREMRGEQRKEDSE